MFFVNITDKQMLASVADVQEGCRERLCNECTLYTVGLSCGVARSNPVCWTVPALKVVLTEDDKVIVRRLLQNGLTWAAMNVSATKNVTLFSDKPSVDQGFFRDLRVGFSGKLFPKMLLPWATHEGSPYCLPDLVEGG